MTDIGQAVKLSERHCKIIVAMHALSPQSPQMLRYEDIVVKAFEMFPAEFQLRGHPQFPDASDIHKPLYGPLKRMGLVTAANKRFRLTQRGLEVARRVAAAGIAGPGERASGQRLSRDAAAEVRRLLSSSAYQLFSEGKTDQILDTDFYAFFRVSVRTPRNDFLGRVTAVTEAIAQAVAAEEPGGRKLQEILDLLLVQFSSVVCAKKGE